MVANVGVAAGMTAEPVAGWNQATVLTAGLSPVGAVVVAALSVRHP
ncbi:hypothetical protein FHX42_004270 [Saccharopolyspora lacisalsi]|uniref:Uncharacterized protein n=1 Tax=Halosaccharopolyspora lacisalsi TaxID=1000566 RepID=A0A839E6F4_9PSEU|nr:hypothetical protein [Halosaccharopolyspora lacisalsi]MBA8826891.1 hypothetical protein [Halosaccharopolyspora lacisalsi]